MDEDHLTRVEADAEDRVRLVAQRPTPAVEEIGLHHSTLPFRSPTRPRGPSRNRGRRPAGEEPGFGAGGADPGSAAEASPGDGNWVYEQRRCRGLGRHAPSLVLEIGGSRYTSLI